MESDTDSDMTSVADISHPESPAPIASNTLILAKLPPDLFLNSVEQLRALIERWGGGGTIFGLYPLKSFGRMLVVYEATEQAMRARIFLEREKSFTGKVYYGEAAHPLVGFRVCGITILALLEPWPQLTYSAVPSTLHPPEAREAGPNYRVLSDDFVQRFAELDLDTFELDAGHTDNDMPSSALEPLGASTFVFSSASASGPSGPTSASNAPSTPDLATPSRTATQASPGPAAPLVIRVEDWTNSVRPKAVSDIELVDQEMGNIALQRRLELDNKRWAEQHKEDFEGEGGEDVGHAHGEGAAAGPARMPRVHSRMDVKVEEGTGSTGGEDFATEEEYRAEIVRRMKRMPPKTRMPPVPAGNI
ncbi:hypothetical protein HDU93_003343 [Gonapodya sp. JEL0774]|nr:hypothetical protein HDU93_003343 [Gonapodya sp. JEL0774]